MSYLVCVLLYVKLWCKIVSTYDKNKRPGDLTSYAASGNTPWNAPKYTPPKYYKTRRWWNQWKYLWKWQKTWIMFYFGNQSVPVIVPLRPIFHIPLKVAHLDMHNKDWCQPSGNLFRKWPKTGIVTYFGAQSGPKNGTSEANDFDTYQSIHNEHVKQYWCWACEIILVLNQWKLFEKNDQRDEFYLSWVLKWPPNVPYSTHCWKYFEWASEAILMWSQWKLYEIVTKVQHFDLIWGPELS